MGSSGVEFAKVFHEVVRSINESKEIIGHSFIPRVSGTMGLRYICTECKVEISPSEHKWYILGRKHGGNNV